MADLSPRGVILDLTTHLWELLSRVSEHGTILRVWHDTVNHDSNTLVTAPERRITDIALLREDPLPEGRFKEVYDNIIFLPGTEGLPIVIILLQSLAPAGLFAGAWRGVTPEFVQTVFAEYRAHLTLATCTVWREQGGVTFSGWAKEVPHASV